MFSFALCYRYLPERDGMLSTCLTHLSLLGCPIHIGGALQDGKFSRAAALNEAIKKATTPWIVAMDVDMLLPPDFLQRVRPFLDKKRLLTFDFYEDGGQRFPDSPGGANVFWLGLWRSVDGYCEDYRGYGFEDYDFQRRVLEAGYEVANTHIEIQHLQHPQVAGIYDDLERNKKIYEGASNLEDSHD